MFASINRRALIGTAAATVWVGIATKPGPAKAHDAFSGYDALGQAALVRSRQATSVELVDAAIARIEAVNPQLNAVVTDMFDEARAKATTALPQSALSGVPYLIKDLYDIAGERTTSGSRFKAHFIADKTDLMPQKAIDAGLVIVGKTNTPEFGLLATTESLLLGPCHNPWNLDYSTGGSSGGGAAAVAAGLVPVASASDSGGSIRIPSSCCGVFGMKPSRGRMALGPSRLAGNINVQNCVSRSVRDSAMVFSLSEDTTAGAALKPVGFVAGPSKKRLKIAFSTANHFGTEPHPDVKAALEASAKLCGSLGHEIVVAQNPVRGEAFIGAFATVWASIAARLVTLAQSNKQNPQDVFEPWTLGLAEFFAKQPNDALADALTVFKQTEAQIDAFLAQYDAWLTPVLSAPPVHLGEQAPTVPFATLYDRTMNYAAYTPLHNVAGTPAMSVPLGISKNNLPIGSQFAAAKGAEDLLFALAFELEQAQPWSRRTSPVFAG